MKLAREWSLLRVFLTTLFVVALLLAPGLWIDREEHLARFALAAERPGILAFYVGLFLPWPFLLTMLVWLARLRQRGADAQPRQASGLAAALKRSAGWLWRRWGQMFCFFVGAMMVLGAASSSYAENRTALALSGGALLLTGIGLRFSSFYREGKADRPVGDE